MKHHFFRPRDEDGNLVKQGPKAEPLSYKEVFWRVWQRRGLKENQIQFQWEKYQREYAEEQKRLRSL